MSVQYSIYMFIGLSIPFSLPWRCPLCSVGKIDIAPRESTRIVVNLRGKLLKLSCSLMFIRIYLGRYDLNDVQPICESCGEQIHLQSPHDIIREQYWPGSASRKSTYLFDTDLFLFYDLLKKNNPGVSETGFLKTLEQISLAKGRVCNKLIITASN